MLILRNRTMRFAFIGILMLIAGLPAAKTEAVSYGSPDPSGAPNIQGHFIDQTNEMRIAIAGASQDPCVDVSLSEGRDCRNEVKVSIPVTGPGLDECFDVPLMERASCRNAIQRPIR